MRKSIKKLFAIMLAAAMAVGLTACGGQGEQSSEQQKESQASSGGSTSESKENEASAEADREPITLNVAT